MIETACNDFVLILRDETLSQKGGMLVASQGREKPHIGVIHAVGDTVASANVKAAIGRKCIFHSGSGFEIEYEDIIYLVVEGLKIIAIP